MLKEREWYKGSRMGGTWPKKKKKQTNRKWLIEVIRTSQEQAKTKAKLSYKSVSYYL